MAGQSSGRIMFGGQRRVSDSVQIYGENSFDILAARREFISSFGVDYQVFDHLSIGGAIAHGSVINDQNGDLTRQAYSVNFAYDDTVLSARGRLEFRNDQEFENSGRATTDTVTASADLQYQIDPSRRLLSSVTVSSTQADTQSLLGGNYADVTFGYAYRPVFDDSVNILASYRYLHDTFGQQLDGAVGAGAIQRSHVLNLEGNFDLSDQWTIGAKLGFRSTQSAPQKGTALSNNDAALTIINARYALPKNWDMLFEMRHFQAFDTGFSETGGLAAVYRDVTDNISVGVGYNFTNFSDDLTDLSADDGGAFINIIAKF